LPFPLFARTPAVSGHEEKSTLILKLHFFFNGKNFNYYFQNRQKTRELFVHSCIERIAASMAEDPSFTDMESVASRIAERSLVLLRIFVDNLYQPVYQIPTIKPKPKKVYFILFFNCSTLKK